MILRSAGLEGVLPSETTVWSGAGVSVEGPSSLPTGWELCERIFDQMFLPGLLDEILATHSAVGWIDLSSGDARMPRLETVLGVAVDILGEQALRILDDIKGAKPNRLHYFFADHLAAGGKHITANFDLCTEAAAEELGHRCSVFHFHGALRSGDPYLALGATLARIQGGFTPDMKSELVGRLRSRLIVVVGYSGSDFFDVDQAIAALPDSELDGVSVLWVAHSDEPLSLDCQSAHCQLVEVMRAKGASVTIVHGRTHEVLDELAKAWAFGPLRAEPVRTLRTPRVSVTDADRTRCSLALARRAGIWRIARMLLDSAQAALLSEADRWLAEMELLWEEGQWSTARKSWRRHGPRLGHRDLSLERVGACLWAQGRLIPAYGWLLAKQSSIHDPAVRLQALESMGRAVEHMARSPDTRLLVRPLARRVRRVLPTTTPADGIDMHRRIVDLRSSLDHILRARVRRPGTAMESSEWFQQVGSISATLSYHHRELRDSYSESLPTEELISLYRRQQELTLAIGALGGAARVALLPGAHRVLTRHEVKESLQSISLAPWHRFRLRMFDERARMLERLRKRNS